jgi:hypothetical protein
MADFLDIRKYRCSTPSVSGLASSVSLGTVSGERHHTIPQFLQRGFSVDRRASPGRVWMYRKGQRGFLNGITNVSVELNFYGEPSESDLDARITNLESVFAPLVARLRVGECGAISDPQIPYFVAHCSVRTRHLRESAIGLVEEILDELRRLLNRNEVIYALMSKELGRSGSARAGVESALLATGTDPAELGAVINKMRKSMSAVVASLDPSIADGVKVGIEAYVAEARSLLPAIIRKSFIDGMSRDFDLWERVEQYGRFCWHVVSADETLILGDTIVIFETGGKLRFKPFADGSDDVRVIYLPIASDRLLVGSLNRSTPGVNVESLNEAISRCSFEFFVSSRELSMESNLASDIGRWSGLMTRKATIRILRELERSFLAR